MSVLLSICFCPHLFVHLSITIEADVCSSLNLFLSASLRSSIYHNWSRCLFFSQSASVCICLFIFLSQLKQRSVLLSICFCLHLFVHLSITIEAEVCSSLNLLLSASVCSSFYHNWSRGLFFSQSASVCISSFIYLSQLKQRSVLLSICFCLHLFVHLSITVIVEASLAICVGLLYRILHELSFDISFNEPRLGNINKRAYGDLYNRN